MTKFEKRVLGALFLGVLGVFYILYSLVTAVPAPVASPMVLPTLYVLPTDSPSATPSVTPPPTNTPEPSPTFPQVQPTATIILSAPWYVYRVVINGKEVECGFTEFIQNEGWFFVETRDDAGAVSAFPEGVCVINGEPIPAPEALAPQVQSTSTVTPDAWYVYSYTFQNGTLTECGFLTEQTDPRLTLVNLESNADARQTFPQGTCRDLSGNYVLPQEVIGN